LLTLAITSIALSQLSCPASYLGDLLHKHVPRNKAL
jgi:hypothetical protein